MKVMVIQPIGGLLGVGAKMTYVRVILLNVRLITASVIRATATLMVVME